MQSRYKAKGRGDTRDIMDGDRLVGRIHRFKSRSSTIKINFITGHTSLRCNTVNAWDATWGDSDEPVMEKAGEKRIRATTRTIKQWTEPYMWSPGRVLPREVPDAE